MPSPRLKTLNLHYRLRTCDWIFQSHVDHETAHIHCLIRRLWSRYKSRVEPNRLEALSVHLWRRQIAPPHPDEFGRTQYATVRRAVFESMLMDKILCIRLCGDATAQPVYYKQASHPWLIPADHTTSLRTCFIRCAPNDKHCWADEVVGHSAR